MAGAEYLHKQILSRFGYEPTPCQAKLFLTLAEFLTTDEDDILVVNGYAGTGKTTAISAVINALKDHRITTILLAPTGRAAKVLSGYSGKTATTIHKHIYRQKSVNGDGLGQFSLDINKAKRGVFFVDEASLIGIDASQSGAAFGSGNLLEDLICFVRSGIECKLVLIGDSAQLPPIGLDCSPTLSKEYMAMLGGVSFVKMNTVVRQKKASGILHNATLLRTLIESENYGAYSDFQFDLHGFDDIQKISGGELVEAISDAYNKFGEDQTIVLARSNKRANRYNAGIRSMVQFKEERLVRGDKLMIVKNCYKFAEEVEGLDFIANGDLAELIKINKYEERYGLHFAQARLSLPDYGDQEIVAKVILDTLESESASLTYEEQNNLYQGVNADYSHIKTKKKRYEAVREDLYFNALQLKYANAITGHKSQGGQWKCVFIDNNLWQPDLSLDDLKWLYTALTRSMEKVYLVNFKDKYFK